MARGLELREPGPERRDRADPVRVPRLELDLERRTARSESAESPDRAQSSRSGRRSGTFRATSASKLSRATARASTRRGRIAPP